MDGMELDLSYGQPRSVKSWKVDIQKSGQTVQTISGTAPTLPAAIAWDGTKADGRLADEGSYSATLSVDYGSVFNPASAKSEAFVLDLRAPQGEIVLSPPLFSPIEGNTSLGITVKATSVNAKMDSWSMKIYDPAGNLFKSFEGKWPDTRVEWDGKSIEGDLVESAEDYPVTATVRDEFGNSSQLKSMIPVDVLVEKLPRGYRILSSRIFFKAFEADYIGVSADLAAQNTQRLNDLAAKLKKFPGYRIRLVGHAVMINWDDPARGRIEQNEVLIPLGLARAEAIKKAMTKRGLDPRMISTEGVGGVDQLVPDSDLVNRWRNRRVAFYLEKP
jgi:flagellar motor protein MotB